MPLSRITFAAVLAALSFTLPALAEGVSVEDPYARSSGPSAKSGAAFMLLRNDGPTDDRLTEVRSDVAERVELHTHISDANGVMRMVEVEDGIAVPAGGEAALMRGGDHVMLMGLRRALEQGDTIEMTLVFERAGEIEVSVPVDLDRAPRQGHGAMSPGG